MEGSRKGIITKVLRVVLGFGWYVQILGVVLLLGTMVATMFGVSVPTTIPFAFELDREVYEIGVGSLGGEATIRVPSGSLEIEDPAFGVVLGFNAFALLGMVIGLVVLYQLRKVARTLGDDPFVRDNVRRFWIVALSLFGWELLRSASTLAWSILVHSNAVTEGVAVRPGPDVQFGTLFAVLALLVVAEVFRVGSELREDQRLTV